MVILHFVTIFNASTAFKRFSSSGKNTADDSRCDSETIATCIHDLYTCFYVAFVDSGERADDREIIIRRSMCYHCVHCYVLATAIMASQFVH